MIREMTGPLSCLFHRLRINLTNKQTNAKTSLCLYASVMTDRTLYLGSSHLVPMEMVWPPQVFVHYPGREKQARRCILASDLPPDALDVKGGRTVAETVLRYRDISKNLTTWRAAHPYSLARAIILLGGNLVKLTKEHRKDPRTPRRKCRTLIADPYVLKERNRKIARDLIALRGLLLQYVPEVYVCTILPRATPPTITFDEAIDVINQHLGDGIPPTKLIRLHEMIVKDIYATTASI